MTDKKSLIEFPCHFPIKIVGTKTETFFSDINTIINKHFPETLDEMIVVRESQQGNYLSITVTVYVHDQDSLDALYREISSHPEIKMVL